jgi:hypothetical protein
VGLKIVCSKALVHDCAHIWTLKGASVFEKVTVAEYNPGTMRVEGVFSEDSWSNLANFKANIVPQLGMFKENFAFDLIHSGIPGSVEKVSGTAKALLAVVCRIEKLKEGSLQFMLDQFISKQGQSEDISICKIQE